tara:strand:+ start:198 stop:344 length:147 start_codon:yes stop_codon:yes gene_type:complete
MFALFKITVQLLLADSFNQIIFVDAFRLVHHLVLMALLNQIIPALVLD